jgi:hypothetical protein
MKIKMNKHQASLIQELLQSRINFQTYSGFAMGQVANQISEKVSNRNQYIESKVETAPDGNQLLVATKRRP